MLNWAHSGPIAQRERSGTGTRVHARRGAGAHLLDRQIHRSARIAVANQSHKRRDGGQEQRHALRIYIHESAQGNIFHSCLPPPCLTALGVAPDRPDSVLLPIFYRRHSRWLSSHEAQVLLRVV